MKTEILFSRTHTQTKLGKDSSLIKKTIAISQRILQDRRHFYSLSSLTKQLKKKKINKPKIKTEKKIKKNKRKPREAEETWFRFPNSFEMNVFLCTEFYRVFFLIYFGTSRFSFFLLSNSFIMNCTLLLSTF